MAADSALDAQVLRLQAGKTCEPSTDPGSAAWSWVMLPIASMVAAMYDEQLDRLNRFSLPLLPPHTSSRRASATRTAHYFLEQLRSDYRRVATPSVDLEDYDKCRLSEDWQVALNKAGISNRSVAVFAVGQYLASDRTQPIATALKTWTDGTGPNTEAAFARLFGDVVGPLVQLALTFDDHPEKLPSWANKVGSEWCSEFLVAGAKELRGSR
ncbi:hypothetical protein [Mycobacterium sp. DBP42]|uniref:hypothetical protein n=1 Tax=Mycobacterium sp. DBP42 TaxID=2545267 RepID=UPI00110CBF10|nr:hypothetical protein [Mycobacterium sp. DBP42]TMS45965.1 hypothetical protein E0T84_30350 [Mycobacterium sp. DBP42]